MSFRKRWVAASVRYALPARPRSGGRNNGAMEQWSITKSPHPTPSPQAQLPPPKPPTQTPSKADTAEVSS